MLRFALSLLILFIPLLTFAQEAIEVGQTVTVDSQINEGETEAIIVANVDIQDAKIIKQEGNIFTITFSLSNQTGVQPDINYAIHLVKTDEASSTKFIDTKVYPDKLFLGENEKVTKTITYEAPTYLSGMYELVLDSSTGSGMHLSIVGVGDIELMGDGQYVDILSDTCYFTVEGDADQQQYPIQQGIDLSGTETLLLTCTLQNHTNNELTLTPQLETRYRTVFGKKIETSPIDSSPIQLEAGATQAVTLTIPKATEPQSYAALLSFTTEPAVSSAQIVASYILRGDSVTIQNVTLDKNKYSAGETAEVTFVGYSFSDSLIGTGTPTTSPVIKISIIDQAGTLCGTGNVTPLEDTTPLQVIAVPITQDCVTPRAKVEIVDNDNNVLASNIFTYTDTIPEPETPVVESDNATENLLLIIAVIVIVLLAVIFLMIRNRRNNFNTDENDMTPPTGVGLMLLLVLFGSLLVPKDVSAITLTTGLGDGVAYGTFTLNKSSYAPGESIRVNTYLWMARRPDKAYFTIRREHYIAVPATGINTTNFDSMPGQFEPRGYENQYRSAYLSAPSSGSHYVGVCLRVYVGGHRPTCSSALSFSITNPPTNGACGWGNGSSFVTVPASSQCSAGSASGVSNGGSTWNWSCAGSNGGGTAWCASTRLIPTPGVCGSATTGTYGTAPNANLCSVGASTAVSPNGANNWSWSCLGTNTGANAPCSAARVPAPTVNLRVNGVDILPANSLLDPSDITLTWTSTGDPSTTCLTSGNWSGAVSKSNTTGYMISDLTYGSYVYNITCTDPYGRSGQDSVSVTIPQPTATITASDCPIPENQSTCTQNIGWNFNYATPGYLVKDGSSTYYSGNTPNSSVLRTFSKGPYVISAYHRGGTDWLVSKSINADCDQTVQNGKTMIVNTHPSSGNCEYPPDPPIITIITTPQLVRSGNHVDVKVETKSAEELKCKLLGANTTPDEWYTVAGTNSNDVITTEKTLPSKDLFHKQQVLVECYVDRFPIVKNSVSASIDVVGTQQEI